MCWISIRKDTDTLEAAILQCWVLIVLPCRVEDHYQTDELLQFKYLHYYWDVLTGMHAILYTKPILDIGSSQVNKYFVDIT